MSNGEKMGPSPILSIIRTATMLILNGGNNERELKNITCKQTLSLS